MRFGKVFIPGVAALAVVVLTVGVFIVVDSDDGSDLVSPTTNIAPPAAATPEPRPTPPAFSNDEKREILEKARARAKEAREKSKRDPGKAVCLDEDGTISGFIVVDAPDGAKPLTDAEQDEVCAAAKKLEP